MPAKFSMTWEGGPRRWRKMHKGQTYVVSCRELDITDTKEGSYQAANEWWQKKLAEIANVAPTHPHQETISKLEHRRSWADKQGLPELEHRLDTVQDFVYQLPHYSPAQIEDLVAANLGEMANFTGWDETPGVVQDRTVAAQVGKYLDLEKARVQGNVVSVGEFEIVSRALHDFRDWIGGGISIETIDADKVEEYWSYLISTKLSIETKKKKLRHAKNFIGWMAEKGKIPRPSNLDSRKHRFGGGLKEILTIPTSELKGLIDAAPGQLKLHLLLMANCGMTQIDLTELHPSEVDWVHGRIRRKRSKTSEHANVPTVDYPLWPVTFDLLKKYGHRVGNNTLLTSSGLLWVRDILKTDGKRSKVDNIKSNFAHIKKRKSLLYSLKAIRKTSASLMETQPEFARYATMFLGHSPRTIADRHYVTPSREQFDRAVQWLGKEFGLA